MSDTSRKRRLAAILFADMVGYSALANQDEARALALLDEVRAVFAAGLRQHNGVLVKQMGDGFLAQFDNALGAVQFAAELQETLHRLAGERPQETCARLRVGIHLGDVEQTGDDVFGNGVNIAARVEPLASPGEVWFTQEVWDQVRNPFGSRVVPAGSRRLKNIAHPVRLYRLPPPGKSIARERALEVARRVQRVACPVVLVLAVIAAIVLATGWLRPHATSARQLVVLPFDVAKQDGELSERGEGLAKALVSALSRLSEASGQFEVVASRAVEELAVTGVGEARERLRADRVLCGRLQRSGGVVRISLDLVDAVTLRVLDSAEWAVGGGDDFRLQEEAALRAARLLKIPVSEEMQARLNDGGTRNADANAAYLAGLGKRDRYDNAELLQAAIAYFRSAVKQDPNFALAHAELAWALWNGFLLNSDPEFAKEARSHAEQAAALAPRAVEVRCVLGMVYDGTGDRERALDQLNTAVLENPLNPEALRMRARVLAATNWPMAERDLLRAVALRTNHWVIYNELGKFYFDHGDYTNALEQFEEGFKRTADNYLVVANLGAANLALGRYGEAKHWFQQSMTIRTNDQALANLGYLLFFERNFHESAAAFRQATKLASNVPEYWLGLGDALRLAGVTNGSAQKAYDKAIDSALAAQVVNKHDYLRLGVQAFCRAQLGDLQGAEERVRTARTSDPNSAQLAFLAVLIYEKGGQRDKALGELKAALRLGHPRYEIEHHPDLEELRKDPRLPDLLNTAETAR